MKRGKVRWFNSTKGYGFLVADDDDKDIFVHYSSISMQGYKDLQEGQTVQFDLYEGAKGAIAQNVEVLS